MRVVRSDFHIDLLKDDGSLTVDRVHSCPESREQSYMCPLLPFLQRYAYLQPGFTSGASKKFVVPSPNTYDVRGSPVGAAAKANKFGTGGRSPVGIVYS